MKSSENHTPGPWQVGHFNANMICDCDGDIRGCSPIAYVEGSAAEKRANARLIASAPDLMSQLDKCVRYLADLNGSQWINGTDDGSIDMRQRAIALQQLAFAAIAKATGGKA